jgi:hypothetical protein
VKAAVHAAAAILTATTARPHRAVDGKGYGLQRWSHTESMEEWNGFS